MPNGKICDLSLWNEKTSLSNQLAEILKHHALPPHSLESNLIQKWVYICLEMYYKIKKVQMKSRFVSRFCKQTAERLLNIVKNASHKKRIDTICEFDKTVEIFENSNVLKF